MDDGAPAPEKTGKTSADLTLDPGKTAGDTTPVSIQLEDGTLKVIEGLDKAALKALANDLGVTVHPNAGAAKITEALLAAYPVE